MFDELMKDERVKELAERMKDLGQEGEFLVVKLIEYIGKFVSDYQFYCLGLMTKEEYQGVTKRNVVEVLSLSYSSESGISKDTIQDLILQSIEKSKVGLADDSDLKEWAEFANNLTAKIMEI